MIDLPPWNLVRHKCMDSCGMLQQLIGNGCPSLGNIGNFSGERPGGWFFRDLWLCHWVWRDVGPPSELQGCSTTVFWGLKFRIKRINTPRNAEQVKLVWFYIRTCIYIRVIRVICVASILWLLVVASLVFQRNTQVRKPKILEANQDQMALTLLNQRAESWNWNPCICCCSVSGPELRQCDVIRVYIYIYGWVRCVFRAP